MRSTALVVAAPAMLAIGLFISASTTARANLHPTTSLGASALGFAIATLVAAVPAIALIITSARARRRSGVVLGSVLAGIALLFCGVPFVTAATTVTVTLFVNQAPTTEAESRYSIFDLGVLAADFGIESTSGLGEGSAPSATTDVKPCELSNLSEGSRVVGERHFPTTSSRQEALDTIAATWRQAGYDVIQHDTFITATGTGWLDEAAAFWQDDGSVDLSYASICVIAER